MEIEKCTITCPGIFVVVSFLVIASGFAEVFCPKYVTIEEGDTAMVSCNITAREIVFVYWYKGDTTTTSPILRLENGKPGGTEYGRGHYNITSNGAMIITDAKVLHEALYTTLMHFHDGTGESKHINVTTTFTPWPSCPIIDGCLPCEECSLAVNDTGKLICHINGARPIIPLEWIIKHQHGVSILKESPIFTKDIGSDTWNSSAELSFSVSSCNQEATILCVAEDHLSLLDHFKSVIKIRTGDCSDTSPVEPSVDTLKIFIIVSVLIVGISSVIVVIYIYVIWRRKNMMPPKEVWRQTKGANIVSIGRKTS